MARRFQHHRGVGGRTRETGLWRRLARRQPHRRPRPPEAILAATSHIVVGTSIIDIWRADPAKLAAGQARIAHQFPGRFYLGIGSSHAPTAESVGASYQKPLSRLRTYMTEGLASVPAEAKMIAALGPRALETARDLTAGALPYLMPPQHTAGARAILGPDRLLIPEQKIYLGTNETVARAVGRARAAVYLTMPNYVRRLREYGLTDEDFAGEGSDRYVDMTVAWGTGEQIRSVADAHLAAGADQIALQVLSDDSTPQLPRAEWREVAEVLFS